MTIPHPGSQIGWEAYLAALTAGKDRDLHGDDLQEYALHAVIVAEQQDCQRRIQWAVDRLTDIQSRKPIIITRFLDGSVALPGSCDLPDGHPLLLRD